MTRPITLAERLIELQDQAMARCLDPADCWVDEAYLQQVRAVFKEFGMALECEDRSPVIH